MTALPGNGRFRDVSTEIAIHTSISLASFIYQYLFLTSLSAMFLDLVLEMIRYGRVLRETETVS